MLIGREKVGGDYKLLPRRLLNSLGIGNMVLNPRGAINGVIRLAPRLKGKI